MKRIMAACVAGVLSIAVVAGCSIESEPELVATTDEGFQPSDLTEGLQEVYGGDDSIIVSAMEVEERRYEVATTIVDPRGDEGSEQANLAIEICETILDRYGDDVYVNITEADGTSFVLANHPMTGPDCTEY